MYIWGIENAESTWGAYKTTTARMLNNIVNRIVFESPTSATSILENYGDWNQKLCQTLSTSNTDKDIMKIKRPTKDQVFKVITEDYLEYLKAEPDLLKLAAAESGGPFMIAPNSTRRFYQDKDYISMLSEAAEIIYSAKTDVISADRNCNISFLRFNEYQLPKSDFVMRYLTTTRNDYDTNVSEHFHCCVRSDKEEYTQLDGESFIVSMIGTPGFIWFLVRGHELDWWIQDLAVILNTCTEEQFRVFKEALEFGWLARPVILQTMERVANEKQQAALFEYRQSLENKRKVSAARDRVYKFFGGSITKLRLGAWKLERRPLMVLDDFINPATLVEDTSRYAIILDNTHVVLEGAVSKTFSNEKISEMGELDVLKLLVRIPEKEERRHYTESSTPKESPEFKENILKINGINVVFDWKHYRPYLFGKPVKKTELHEILQSMCCENTLDEMVSIANDCSVLSLSYRKYLSEGVRREVNVKMTYNTEMISAWGIPAYSRHGNHTAMGQQFPTTGARHQSDVSVKLMFKLERRGSRGVCIPFTNSDGSVTKYKVYPKDLEECCVGDGHPLWKRMEKLLECGTLIAKKIFWRAFKDAHYAYHRSKESLDEVCTEIGAVKKNLTIQDKSGEFYVFSGNSGALYAIKNESGKCSVYRKNSEHSNWYYLCIDTVSDASQEVGKDNLVTRMMALVNDDDSSVDIGTLKDAARTAPVVQKALPTIESLGR